MRCLVGIGCMLVHLSVLSLLGDGWGYRQGVELILVEPVDYCANRDRCRGRCRFRIVAWKRQALEVALDLLRFKRQPFFPWQEVEQGGRGARRQDLDKSGWCLSRIGAMSRSALTQVATTVHVGV